MPLQAAAQPADPDPVEVTRLAATRLVRALRHTRVAGRIPHLAQPPRPGVVADRQEPPATAQLLADVPDAAQPGQGAGAAQHRQRDLLLPVPQRQPGKRNRGPRAKIADHLTEPPHQRPHVGNVKLPALLDDAEHAPGQLLAHRRRQPRQVNPRGAPPPVSQPAAELLRDGVRAEIRQAHAGRQRLPQALQDLRPVTGRQAAAARCGIQRCAAHEPNPVCREAAAPPRGECLPLRNGPHFRVVGDVTVDVQRGLHVSVAEPAADHVHRHPGQQQGRGMAVPEPVRRPARWHLPGQRGAQPPDQVIDRLRPPRREPWLTRQVHEHAGFIQAASSQISSGLAQLPHVLAVKAVKPG